MVNKKRSKDSKKEEEDEIAVDRLIRELHHPVRINFPRRRTLIRSLGELQAGENTFHLYIRSYFFTMFKI